MTAEGQKCSLGSLISMSCRGRAQAFARRLHTKLTSLGTNEHDDQDRNGSPDESSWLAAAREDSDCLPVAVAQPRLLHLDCDLELPESPASPDDEPEMEEMCAPINRDTLRHSHSDGCQCGKDPQKNSLSNDSDSDGSFYDTENDVDQRPILNGNANSEGSSLSNLHSDSFATTSDSFATTSGSFASTSDCTPQQSSSSTEDASTLSLREEGCPSLTVNGSLTDVSRLEEDDVSVEVDGGIADERDGELDKQEKDNGVFVVDSSAVETTTDYWNGDPSNYLNDPEYDEDDGESRIPRVRRCSSLKTGKTPPGTPAIKKIVRFADVLGLDLADVRTFLDEVPKVPVSAFEDLSGADLSESSDVKCPKADKLLIPLFQQPGGQPDFLDSVRENQVRLENALVDDPISLSVSGTVRVRNLDFHKSVHIRYSLDAWKTFADVQALYVDNSCDGFSDKFAFLLYAHTLSVGQRLEFACRFQCKGCQYWDSNRGANYCFQCLPTSNRSTVDPPSIAADDWGASFCYHGIESTRLELQDRIMASLATKGTAAPAQKERS
ncbi:unnamed protein product, partial [Phaedon cochleariae]